MACFSCCLLGLLIGFAEGQVINPRMALAAHLGRSDERHMPDCVGGGVAVCESLPCGSGKKIQTVKLAASNLMLGKSTRGISQGKNG
jgi:hypothetical protein